MAREHVGSEFDKNFQVTDHILMVPVRVLEAGFPGGVAGYIEKYRAILIPELKACAIRTQHKKPSARKLLAKFGIRYSDHMLEVGAERIPWRKSTEPYRRIGMEFPLYRSWFRIHPNDYMWSMVEDLIRFGSLPEDVDDDPTTDPGTRE